MSKLLARFCVSKNNKIASSILHTLLFDKPLGWRSIFFISAGLGLFTATIAFVFLGKGNILDDKKRKINLKGTMFYIIGLICLVYGLTQIPAAWAWIIMGFGAVFLVVFWFIETRSSAPVIDTKLFSQNRLFTYSNIAALINYSATFAIVFLLSLFLQNLRGLNPRDAGLILVAQPVIMAIFSPIAGRLSDKIQARFLTSVGMAMCTIGLTVFCFIGETTPISLILANLIWLGLGFALFSSPKGGKCKRIEIKKQVNYIANNHNNCKTDKSLAIGHYNLRTTQYQTLALCV